jgi:hypothetical protein
MLTLATLGVKPAAMAWTDDAEERGKALYAVLREGAPSLVFDNIPRGTVIGCPGARNTAEVYKDRVLGVSEAPSARLHHDRFHRKTTSGRRATPRRAH